MFIAAIATTTGQWLSLNITLKEIKMGNQAGSLKKHLETAEKTGALNFTDKGLEKFPPDMSKVSVNIRILLCLIIKSTKISILFVGWEELKELGPLE